MLSHGDSKPNLSADTSAKGARSYNVDWEASTFDQLYPTLYDMDSCLLADNNGYDQFPYYAEMWDSYNGNKIVNGSENLFWQLWYAAFYDDYKALYCKLRDESKTLSPEKYILVLLQAVIIAAVPVVTTYLCNFLKQKSNQAAAKTNNDLAASYIREAADAVTTAVTFTSQTYVDNLKSSGTFTVENQKEAFNKAMNKAVEILSAEAKEYLAKAYGDLTNYLTTKIEAEVRNQKSTAILTGELITE